MADTLKPLLTPTTLVVQSTDYSHYRPIGEAVARDQETIAAITAGDPAGHRSAAPAGAHGQQGRAIHPARAAERAWCDAGDPRQPQLGRVWRQPGRHHELCRHRLSARSRGWNGVRLSRPDPRDVRRRRAARPLLPAALRDPEAWTTAARHRARHHPQHAAHRQFRGRAARPPGCRPRLQRTSDDDRGRGADRSTALNVTAASLANNHANDLGPAGRAETVAPTRSHRRDAAGAWHHHRSGRVPAARAQFRRRQDGGRCDRRSSRSRLGLRPLTPRRRSSLSCTGAKST